MGGVSASFASLGDIIIAETDATYGFSGRMIIEETLGKKLPKNFQSAKLCQKYGMVDIVANFKDIKSILQSWVKEQSLIQYITNGFLSNYKYVFLNVAVFALIVLCLKFLKSIRVVKTVNIFPLNL